MEPAPKSTSHRGSPKLQPASSDLMDLPTSPQPPPLKLGHYRLVVQHPLPSLNAVLALGHWQRLKLKKLIQASMLSALRASEHDSSTPITSYPSGTLTPSDTLESYLQTRQTERELKRANKKSKPKRKKGRRLKS